MRFTRRILGAAIVTIMLFTVAASAQDTDHDVDLVAEWLAEEHEMVVDGQMNESRWQEASYEQVEMDGVDDEEDQRFAQVYALHNGTELFLAVVVEEGSTLTLQFNPGGDPEATGGLDALRVSEAGEVEDLQWDADSRTWIADAGDGCGANGTAAVDTSAGFTVFEISKPLDGDACDGFIPYGQTVGIRMELQAGGETYRWPAGSAGPDEAFDRGEFRDNIGGWAELQVLERFGEEGREDVGGDIGRDPRPTQGEPGLETGERPGVDDFGPRGPAGPAATEDRGGAYNAEDRGAPGPGLVLIALVGVGALAVITVLRRGQ